MNQGSSVLSSFSFSFFLCQSEDSEIGCEVGTGKKCLTCKEYVVLKVCLFCSLFFFWFSLPRGGV